MGNVFYALSHLIMLKEMEERERLPTLVYLTSIISYTTYFVFFFFRILCIALMKWWKGEIFLTSMMNFNVHKIFTHLLHKIRVVVVIDFFYSAFLIRCCRLWCGWGSGWKLKLCKCSRKYLRISHHIMLSVLSSIDPSRDWLSPVLWVPTMD